MREPITLKPLFRFLKERSLSFTHGNGKLVAQIILTLFFIAIGIWFIKQEHGELQQVKHLLLTAKWQFVLVGGAVTFFYIILQGLMYVASFAGIGCRVSLWSAVILFLKRNFISVFLPAGGVSSLAFFTRDIEKKGITKTQIHFASSIYAFVGILSVVLVALPAFFYALVRGSIGSGEIVALAGVVVLIILLYLVYRSIMHKGFFFRWMIAMVPLLEVFFEDLRNNKINRKQFVITIIYSLFIEFSGISLLYAAMMAMKVHPSLYAALMGYIISVVFLIISPFLRGLGAIEVSMAYILIRFGYSKADAIAITLLYRSFEFWLPLFAGAVSFLLKINRLLMRVVPALFLFLLGVINIISVLTPAIAERVHRLQHFLPVDAITASNYFVLFAGLFLLVTAAFMLKGLRTAWWFALFLSILSLVGNLTKAIDYEEGIVALVVIVILFFTRKEYYILNNPRLRYIGLQSALLSVVAVLVYGTVGFYFLDKRHFNIDFSLLQSIKYTVLNYLMVGSTELTPVDKFARYFLTSINISGLLSLSFLIYTLIRPYVLKYASSPDELERARKLVVEFGRSSLDYFKTYNDKQIYSPPDINGFIAYRVSGNFAMVLEDPVAENTDQMRKCIESFDDYCRENGVKSIYYRVPEESLPIYQVFGKKNLFLGQEAVVDLTTFTMEGRDRKTLRHAVNQIREKGYGSTVHVPPVKDGDLQKIKAVSDEWLKTTGRSEIVFSQGRFDWDELKQQTIITVENPEERVVAFLNIIPDYAHDEATYDLIRKTADAPHNTMEFILIELCLHLQAQKCHYLNLGFAPLSGIYDPQSFPEKSIRFAYEKLRALSHYKGLREFKERFFPSWHNKFLIYDNDYDLLQVPGVLNRIIKP
jgi:phosphatidylglycerol lysyltransferase